mmetsp:Transcript_124506/g.346606  ORF Transcript_124506/g.346606 Transcript_124506/m.346606 type:complete len:255 (+) Transcript_124506:101-865(+)
MAMRRCRPVPLESEEDPVAPWVVKNTFIEVSNVEVSTPQPDAPGPEAAGLRTAPASLHRPGTMQVSLAAAARTPRSTEACPEFREAELESSLTSTTAGSTPPTPAQTPSQACLWPPTPGSPRAPVVLSLVELTSFDLGGPAQPFPVAGPSSQACSFPASGLSPPPLQGPPGFVELSVVPPPPLESPKLPPDVLLPALGQPAGLLPTDGGSPVVACVANARAPRFAPPSAPAPEPLTGEEPAGFHVPPSKAPGTC